jgi:hypothetical protein|tara:strand:- start:1617 stop:1727 length:111 start_codon:yes stop_codon:yes gene_type:complete
MIKLKKKFNTAKAWLIKHKMCTGGGFIAGLVIGVLL